MTSESAIRDGEYVFFDRLTCDDLARLTTDERNAVLSCLVAKKFVLFEGLLSLDDRPLVPTLTMSGISTNAAAAIVLTGITGTLIKISSRCCWHDCDGPQFDGASLENVDLQDETRAHGRPPDSRPPKSHTSDQHDTSVTFSHVFVPSDSETTHVSYARVPFFLAHPQLFSSCFLILLSLQLITINLTPVPDLLRNAGFRAVLQSSLPSAACVAANDCDRATRSQDQQPWRYQIDNQEYTLARPK